MTTHFFTKQSRSSIQYIIIVVFPVSVKKLLQKITKRSIFRNKMSSAPEAFKEYLTAFNRNAKRSSQNKDLASLGQLQMVQRFNY